jgi:UDP-N-acetylglucosamine 2-epimerase (non-hydrolysing)
MQDLDPISVKAQMEDILRGNAKQGVIPPFWDGQASERIADVLISKYKK